MDDEEEGLKEFCSSGWGELCRGHLPIHVPGWKSSVHYLLFGVVTNAVWIEVFYGEGKASVPALLLLHSCWHPVACQHNYTARCMLRNLLSGNEIIKVTAAFQGMPVNLTDIDVLFFLCDFFRGKNKHKQEKWLFWKHTAGQCLGSDSPIPSVGTWIQLWKAQMVSAKNPEEKLPVTLGFSYKKRWGIILWLQKAFEHKLTFHSTICHHLQASKVFTYSLGKRKEKKAFTQLQFSVKQDNFR